MTQEVTTGPQAPVPTTTEASTARPTLVPMSKVVELLRSSRRLHLDVHFDELEFFCNDLAEYYKDEALKLIAPFTHDEIGKQLYAMRHFLLPAAVARRRFDLLVTRLMAISEVIV